MKPFTRIVIFIATILLAPISPAQDKEQKSTEQKPVQDKEQKSPEQKPARQVWIRLKSGKVLTGDLVKMDPESIDFTVKGVLQSVKCDDLIEVMFAPLTLGGSGVGVGVGGGSIEPMTADLRPTITYREKAKYTEEARNNGVEGTVVLQVVFRMNGSITDIRVIRGLPDGLTEKAIEAAKKIRFIPAMREGAPVSVRGNLEYEFNLYSRLTVLTPEDGAEFSHYPRKIEFKWMPVPNAAVYRVLIYQNSPNSPEGIKLQDREIKDTEFVFYFPEAQTGRWRVEAVDYGGRMLAASEWRTFRFTK
jgi:TonB family protein